MSNLIIGLFLGILIIPISDGVLSVILSLFELAKAKIAVQMHRYNKEIENPIEAKKQPIGFIALEEEEDNNDI